MHFATDVYVSDNLINKKDRIMREIKYGKGFNNYYLLYKNNDTGKYECMKSLYFKQKYFSAKPFLIEGIISDHSEVLDILARKTAESMDVIYDS